LNRCKSSMFRRKSSPYPHVSWGIRWLPSGFLGWGSGRGVTKLFLEDIWLDT